MFLGHVSHWYQVSVELEYAVELSLSQTGLAAFKFPISQLRVSKAGEICGDRFILPVSIKHSLSSSIYPPFLHTKPA